MAYNDDEETSTVLGQLALSADGLLAVRSAAPAAKDKVDELVALTNNKPGLHMDVPPLSGSPQFAVASRFVQRGEPDFLAALQDHAEKYYGWTLEH